MVRIDKGFLGGSVVKNRPANAEDAGLISGSGRSPEEGNGNPLQYSCLGNLMDRGAWSAYRFVGSQSETQLSDYITTNIQLLVLPRGGKIVPLNLMLTNALCSLEIYFGYNNFKFFLS